jgi:hypothetical protein
MTEAKKELPVEISRPLFKAFAQLKEQYGIECYHAVPKEESKNFSQWREGGDRKYVWTLWYEVEKYQEKPTHYGGPDGYLTLALSFHAWKVHFEDIKALLKKHGFIVCGGSTRPAIGFRLPFSANEVRAKELRAAIKNVEKAKDELVKAAKIKQPMYEEGLLNSMINNCNGVLNGMKEQLRIVS